MKKLVGSLLSRFLVCLIIGLAGCGDNPKPDPCAKEKPVSADFFIYEAFQSGEGLWKNYDSDTVNSFGVSFVAKEKNATYEWTLGAETITTQSFYRENYPRGQSIEVSLKVTKKPSKACFPDDDGVDIRTRKFFTTKNVRCDSKMNGTYRGADADDPNNLRNVIIDVCYLNPIRPDIGVSLRMNNLAGGCDIFEFGEYQPGYKQVGFGAPGGGTPCLIPVGLAKLDSLNNNVITINYTVLINSNSSTFVKKKFVGKRQ
jgi:hypothetical protein